MPSVPSTRHHPAHFTLPERFELGYIGADNAEHRPVMVHRVARLDRTLYWYLIEHVEAFPLARACQCRLVPIEPHVSFCREFQSRLTALGMRSDLDDRNESMGLKTREAQMAKIPFTLVAGDREMAAGQFAVRKYGERESKVLSLEEIIREFSDLQAVPKKLK